MSHTFDYDVIVIGAGHAGTEAALAAARIGAKTALLTTNLDTVAHMSCNPAIGGVGKGQIVREIDALGGAMGRAIDAACLQFRMLNRRKGPAMHSPRAQADRRIYPQEVKRYVEEQPNLALRQEMVEALLTEEHAGEGGANKAITGVRVAGGFVYRAKAVILTTGTFLSGLLHFGEQKTKGGRAGEGTSNKISDSLRGLGFRVERFKTGTPPRLNARTIDFSRLEEQPGDDDPQAFSFLTDLLQVDQLPCHIAHTNEEVHEIVRQNLHRAPMFCGQIESEGPRYCPSFETKVVRFADKTSHQLFLEPEGFRTHEVYVNGLPTSLPRDVQDEMVRRCVGLERAQIMRYGYAVEYDFCPPDQLRTTLETKAVEGLYFAGQVNGTTGYEEAGAQGLLAGANAALKLAKRSPLILNREQAYIGVLIDDLVTRGVDEPYRMFTSRAEYRLLLRHDNADRRLTRLGHEVGLADHGRLRRLDAKESAIDHAINILRTHRRDGVTLEKLLRRTEVDWEYVSAERAELAGLPRMVAEQVTWDVKYSGYVERQQQSVAKQQRLRSKRIPGTIDYAAVVHLRAEAREKLSRFRPESLDQAARISGITPADVAVLMIHLESPQRG